MKTAVIYARVSSEEQVQNLSLGTQERACREWCERNDATVLNVFVEKGVSAKTTDRPALGEALRYCQRHAKRLDFFVVYDLSRFSRSLEGHYAMSAQLRRLEIALRSVTQDAVNRDDKEKIIVEAFTAAMAEYDNAAKSERVIAGMRDALKAGRWPFPTPIGYRKVDKRLKPKPDTAALVRKGFELMATGLYSQGEVCRQLRALGLKAKRGGKISLQTFTALLRNPVYCGRYKVGGRIDIEGEGGWEPLVTRETWLRVQARLSGHSPTAGARSRERADFPLRGFVLCAETGAAVTSSWSRGKLRSYAYYHPSRQAWRVGRDRLHELFVELVAGLRPTRRFLAAWKAAMLVAWDDHAAVAESQAKALEHRLNALENSRSKLLDLMMAGTVAEDAYKAKDGQLRSEKDAVELEYAENRVDVVDIDAALHYGAEIITRADQLWKDADLPQRKRLQRVLFPQGVEFSPNQGFRTPVTLTIFRPFVAKDLNLSGMVARTGFEPVLPA